MIKYAVYDQTTGEILQTGICPESSIDLKGNGPNESVIIGDASDLAHYVKDGQITEKGDQPSKDYVFDYTLGQWVFDLSKSKSLKWSEIKAAREAQEFGTFDWGGYTFQCDEVSQRRIQGAVQLATIDSSMTLDWTLADNSVQTFSAADFLAIGQALAAHVNSGHVRSRQLRLDIDSATTEAEISAIQW